MSLVINTNISSLAAQKNLTVNTNGLNTALERLSTGFKINRSSDDPSGLSISQTLNTGLVANSKALQNIQNSVNLLSVTEGAMDIIVDNIDRIREISVQAANQVYSSDSLQGILSEISERLEEINRIANSTSFNNVKVTDGSVKTMKVQVGTGSSASVNTIDLSSAFIKCSVTALGIALNVVSMTTPLDGTKINGSNWSPDKVTSYMENLDKALKNLSTSLTNIGAFEGRLEASKENLTTMNTNLTTAKSTILDADIAEESANYIKYQILQQSSATILTQANQTSSMALSLLT